MKSSLLILALASTAFAELSDSPSHAVSTVTRSTGQETAKNPILGKSDKAAILADGLLRIADGITTYKFLSDPCHCYKENNPIAPHVASIPKIAAFQAGAFLLIQGSAYMLDKKNHRKLAKAVRWIDLGSEGYAVSNNIILIR